MAPLPGGKNALFEKAAKNMKGVSDCSVGFSETLGTIKCSLFTNKSYIRRYDEEDSSWKSVCNVQGCIDDQDVCKAVFKHALTHNANKQQLVKYKNKLIAKSCQITKKKKQLLSKTQKLLKMNSVQMILRLAQLLSLRCSLAAALLNLDEIQQ